MFIDKPDKVLPTTIVEIKYDCCGKDHKMKWRDANKNYLKNNEKHICRICQLKSNNPASRPEVQEKMKATNLSRYGATCAMNTVENTAMRVEKMFGTEETTQEIVEKRKQTSIERYGVDHIMKTELGKNKQKEAMQEKYGVDYPLQNEEIKEKTRQTCVAKYGTDNPMQNKEVQLNLAKAIFEKYGVEYYNQLPEMKEYLKINCPVWLAESYKNPWNRGFKRPQEWNDRLRATVREKILSGNWHGGFASNYKGRFPAWKCKKTNPRFLSMLEAKFHLFLNMNDNVEWYDYEGLVIEYKKQDGTPHDYYVDFQVKYFDNEFLQNYELKSWKNKDKFDTQIKYDAAFEYCNNNNMFYYLLFDKEIDELNISNDVILNMPGIEWFARN